MQQPKKKNKLRQRQDAYRQQDPNSYESKIANYPGFNAQTDTLITGKSRMQSAAKMISRSNATNAARKLSGLSEGVSSGQSLAKKDEKWFRNADGSYEVRERYNKEELKNTFKKL
jgi:hypothetical protein